MHFSTDSFLQLSGYGTVYLLMSSCVPPRLDWWTWHLHSSRIIFFVVLLHNLHLFLFYQFVFCYFSCSRHSCTATMCDNTHSWGFVQYRKMRWWWINVLCCLHNVQLLSVSIGGSGGFASHTWTRNCSPHIRVLLLTYTQLPTFKCWPRHWLILYYTRPILYDNV